VFTDPKANSGGCVSVISVVEGEEDYLQELPDSEMGHYFLTEDEQHKRFDTAFPQALLVVHLSVGVQIRDLGEELPSFYGGAGPTAPTARAREHRSWQ
jgi:hypothetical protein